MQEKNRTGSWTASIEISCEGRAVSFGLNAGIEVKGKVTKAILSENYC